MKSLGQINYEGSYSLDALNNWPWDELPDWEKDIFERGANAVADEVLCQIICRYQLAPFPEPEKP